MAFYTGTAADQLALMTAFVDACLLEGFTKTNAILKKGNLFLRPWQKTDAGWGNHFFLQMGKSCDVPETVLIDVIGASVGPGGSNLLQPAAYPISYDLHIFDNEVFLVCWDSQDRHFWVAFGQSSPFTATPAAGNNLWIAGTQTVDLPLDAGEGYPLNGPIVIGPDSGGSSSASVTPAALFWTTAVSGSAGKPPSMFTDNSGAINGGNALPSSPSTTFEVAAVRTLAPLMARSRSAWSHASAALPIQLTSPVPLTSNRKLAIEVQNARYFRLDTLAPRDLATIDGVQYKVYPWYKRNVNERDASGGTGLTVAHTGTFGWAIRYTGV